MRERAKDKRPARTVGINIRRRQSTEVDDDGDGESPCWFGDAIVSVRKPFSGFNELETHCGQGIRQESYVGSGPDMLFQRPKPRVFVKFFLGESSC